MYAAQLARGEVLWLEVLPPPGEVTESQVHLRVPTRSGIPADKELKGHFSNFMIRTKEKKEKKEIASYRTAEFHNEEYLHARFVLLMTMAVLIWILTPCNLVDCCQYLIFRT
jgi:hypothetical protein